MKNPTPSLETAAELKQNSAIVPGEIVLGTVIEINTSGQAVVNFPGNTGMADIPALSTIPVSQKLCGKQVALLFNEGKMSQPVIMGIIHNPLTEILENFELSAADSGHDSTTESEQQKIISSNKLSIDGKRIVLEGTEEIMLKCGDASITLTKSGKIMIRGKYLLNRSTGVNRILGGSVQVN